MEKGRTTIIKSLARRCLIAFLMVACIASGSGADPQECTENRGGGMARELKDGEYFYSHWTISKSQPLPHIVLRDSIGDYNKMEGEYDYFIGRNDGHGRLILSERWQRDRLDVPFPVPEMDLDIGKTGISRFLTGTGSKKSLIRRPAAFIRI